MTPEPFELNEISLCFVAALVEGLRRINEKEAELGIRIKSIDGNALQHYVSRKGDQLIALYLGLRENPDAVKRVRDIWPKAQRFSATDAQKWCKRPPLTPEEIKAAITYLKMGRPVSRVARDLRTSQVLIKRVRDGIQGINDVRCGCGAIPGHRGFCAFRSKSYTPPRMPKGGQVQVN